MTTQRLTAPKLIISYLQAKRQLVRPGQRVDALGALPGERDLDAGPFLAAVARVAIWLVP